MENPNLSKQQNSELGFKKNRSAKFTPVKRGTVKVYVWELPVRVFHWINAAAIILLMITGIYIGNPFVGANTQEEAYFSYLMGWARYVHFFSAFVFTANLLIRWYWMYKGNKYATSNLFRKVFWKEVWETTKFYLFMKNKKPHYVGHNPLAQLSYWIIMVGGSIVMILTGYYLYFEPQPESFLGKLFSWVPYIFGDSFAIRSWHHLMAWGFMVFMVAHIYLSFREDYLQRNGTMSSIFTGFKTEPKKAVEDDDDK
ncbi:Ni/Fe-hydrogenase, b-type cytochrome subunit [Bacillus sp. 1P06AnD]|uniref:Ni/Fe-hydrogenase, b-type cytochrome subunit n=1 Tax=Bacillus sp. 1P06AnD TaxID=3132208 RepID=UPI00399FD716